MTPTIQTPTKITYIPTRKRKPENRERRKEKGEKEKS